MVLNDSCMQPVIAAVVVFKKSHHQTVLKCLKIYLHTRISVNIKLFPCHIFLQNFSSPSSQTCDLVWRFDILQLHLPLGDDRVDHGLDSKPPSQIKKVIIGSLTVSHLDLFQSPDRICSWHLCHLDRIWETYGNVWPHVTTRYT